METAEPVTYECEAVGVVSLPMRDGNTDEEKAEIIAALVVSLPMRDGNMESSLRERAAIGLLAYL